MRDKLETRDSLGRPVTIRVGDKIVTGITEPEAVVHTVIGFDAGLVTCRSCQGGKCWKTEWTPDVFADFLVNHPAM